MKFVSSGQKNVEPQVDIIRFSSEIELLKLFGGISSSLESSLGYDNQEAPLLDAELDFADHSTCDCAMVRRDYNA
jgi:hypothetical protein